MIMKKIYTFVFSFFILSSCGYQTGVQDQIANDYPPSQVQTTKHPDSKNIVEGTMVYEKDWEWGVTNKEDNNGKKEIKAIEVEGI